MGPVRFEQREGHFGPHLGGEGGMGLGRLGNRDRGDNVERSRSVEREGNFRNSELTHSLWNKRD